MSSPGPFSGIDAIVVLGCRLRAGEPGPALIRRLEQAARVSRSQLTLPVIMSGGRRWDGVSESTAMARWWRTNGPSDPELIPEDRSLTTRQNANEVARLLKAREYRHIVLVTCDFHIRRATEHFSRHQLLVQPSPAVAQRSRLARLRLALREWGARRLDPWESWVK